MQRYALMFGFVLLVACSATVTKPTPFSTGDKIDPPAGCVELRKNNQQADC